MKQIIVFSLLIAFTGISAQKPNEKQYLAYLKASKTLWEQSVKESESSYGEKSFEKAMALYGLLSNTMASKDQATFDNYKDETIDILKHLIDNDSQWGEPMAVLASVYGLIIAYSPWRGMYLGMRSSSLMDEAMVLQPESALVQKLFAQSMLYTPDTWGGDPIKARKAYEKSLGLFEESSMKNNWLYLDTLMGLALAHKKSERTEEAIAELEKALLVEPRYSWAKITLQKWKQ